jgi:hypothetical protein
MVNSVLTHLENPLFKTIPTADDAVGLLSVTSGADLQLAGLEMILDGRNGDFPPMKDPGG